MKHKSFDCSPACPVEAALGVIGGKWKGIILYHLMESEMRFSALQRSVGHVTQRMLTKQLRELEADGLISRHVFPVIPPRVEYKLTAKGRTLQPLISALKVWGQSYVLEAPVGKT